MTSASMKRRCWSPAVPSTAADFSWSRTAGSSRGLPKWATSSLNEVEILAGVTEGEAVIVDQIERFRPGDSVRTVIEK